MVQSQWPLVELKNILTTIESGSRPKGGANRISGGVLSLGGEHIDNQSGFITLAAPKYVPISFFTNATKGQIKTGDILLCKDGALTGKIAKVGQELDGQSAMVNEHVFILRSSDIITQNYVFAYLYSEQGQRLLRSEITGSAQGGLSQTNLSQISIPFPPLNIQQQVVSECEAIDTEYRNAKTNIQIARQEILDKFKNINAQKKKAYKLANHSIFDVSIGRRVLDKDLQKNGEVAVYSANVLEPFGYINKLLLTDFSLPSVTWGIDGDWMVNFIPANVKFYPTDHCGVIRIKTPDIEPEYFMFALEEAGRAARFSRTLRASTDRIKAMTIQLPSVESQKEFVQIYRKARKQIEEMEQIIAAAPAKKQAVLDKYL